MTAAHSTWSASRFEQRMLCPGSHALEAGLPDNGNVYAAEGTAAHLVLTLAGKSGLPAAAYVGGTICLDATGRVVKAQFPVDPYLAGGTIPVEWTFTVDEDMAGHVQGVLDYIRKLAGDHPVLWDVRLNYAKYIGVDADDGWGTGDVVILLPDEIVVVDLKYGMGVEVSAGEDVTEIDTSAHLVRKPNPQIALYGLGGVGEYADFAQFGKVRLVIAQPRISQVPSEYVLSVAELERWAIDTAASACNKAFVAATEYDHLGQPGRLTNKEWEEAYLKPGDKQCRFCKAQATCPALLNEVSDALGGPLRPATPDDFASAITLPANQRSEWLAAALLKVDLIEEFCKAVRAEAEARLLNGADVPGFKLVAGKRGNRAWRDPAEVEALIRKTFRLTVEEAYTLKLISPTQAEKLFKAGTIGPQQWEKLCGLVHQPDGKPHVALVSDPRPALAVTPVSEDFTAVTAANKPDEFAWLR